MILWVFIKNFGVKIVITYIYRNFSDIFSEIPVQAHVFHSRDFSVKKLVFFDLFSEKSAILSIFLLYFLCFFFSVPAENRFFNDISTEKKQFFIP